MAENKGERERVIPLKDQELIRQKFAQELVGPVKIDYFTERDLDITVPGRQPCAFCKPTREMLQEIASLHDFVSLRVHILQEAVEERQKFGIDRVPATVLRGSDSAAFIYYGMPGGTEFPAFLESIVDISRGEVLLSEESVKELGKVQDQVTVKVFVTPTCPYCPQMARAAYQMTLANPKVRSEVIEINEFPDLAERYGVQAVPLTVIADRIAIPGAVPENVFVEQVVKASGAQVETPEGASGPDTPAEPPKPDRIERGKERDSGLYIP
jgi:glutaredoxin-like protein